MAETELALKRHEPGGEEPSALLFRKTAAPRETQVDSTGLRLLIESAALLKIRLRVSALGHC